MDEIVVRDGWRERLEGLAGRRGDVRLVALAVAAVTLLALLLWLRSPRRASRLPP